MYPINHNDWEQQRQWLKLACFRCLSVRFLKSCSQKLGPTGGSLHSISMVTWRVLTLSALHRYTPGIKGALLTTQEFQNKRLLDWLSATYWASVQQSKWCFKCWEIKRKALQEYLSFVWFGRHFIFMRRSCRHPDTSFARKPQNSLLNINNRRKTMRRNSIRDSSPSVTQWSCSMR